MGSLEIPLFKEINEHYEAVGVSVRSDNPLFHIARLDILEGEAMNEMYPYRNDFYQIIFGKNVDQLSYSINGIEFQSTPQFILFSAPNQVHSWKKMDNWEGYTICFKAEYLKQFLKLSTTTVFPFFEINEANFLPLSMSESKRFEIYFQSLEKEQDINKNSSQELIKINLLAILYLARRKYYKDPKDKSVGKKGLELIAQYQRLINMHFAEFHMVSDYAKLMNKSSNYLTQVVIALTGKSAKSFIANRIVLEAKYYLSFTELDIAEISYQLNFNSPSHFGQFFKKQIGKTPTTYRNITKLKV